MRTKVVCGMTNKRRDDNRQLQAHELERLEDSPAAEAGTWKKADQSTLAKRRVIKIARRGSSSTTAPSAEAPTKKNPFSSFSGLVSSTQPSKPSTFGSSAPSTTAAPSAVASTGSFTGFGGFNGFQKPIGEASSKTAPASGSFSFGSTKIPVPSSTPNFGSVNLPVPSSTATFPKEGVGLNGGWAPKPLSSTTPPLVALARPPLRSSQNAKRGLEDEPSGFGGGGKGTKTYADQQMEKLNVKFRRWVESGG
uniref:Nuclear pore complex NUP2/50/61 domain-containing protein n=1 Tax=Octactis speculum TaxID=3111310 RepID=A0A7S2H853_9STRA